MSANKLLVADAAAFCAKQRDTRSEKRDRQVASGRASVNIASAVNDVCHDLVGIHIKIVTAGCHQQSGGNSGGQHRKEQPVELEIIVGFVRAAFTAD
jgi:hypothetical protein